MANEVKLHPVTGEELVRATYPRKIEYKWLSKTIQMTGWYTKDDSDGRNSQLKMGIHSLPKGVEDLCHVMLKVHEHHV